MWVPRRLGAESIQSAAWAVADAIRNLNALEHTPQGTILMQTPTRYWFPAKKFGWGWGIPDTWQGWIVLAIFFILLLARVFLFPPATGLIPFLAYVTSLSLGLIAVCWLKGEPPRWRWGDDENN